MSKTGFRAGLPLMVDSLALSLETKLGSKPAKGKRGWLGRRRFLPLSGAFTWLKCAGIVETRFDTLTTKTESEHLPDNDDEHMAMRRRRAVYRGCHRGNREMDYLMGRFAESEVTEMSADELTLFEQLLELPDPVLTGAIIDGHADMSPEHTAFIDRIRAFHKDPVNRF